MNHCHRLQPQFGQPIWILWIVGCCLACTPKVVQNEAAATGPGANASSQESPTHPEQETRSFYCTSPDSDPDDPRAKALVGKTIPDLADSLLLTLVYGSCASSPEGFTVTVRPDEDDETGENPEDAFSMRVEEQLGNESLKLVYLRGEVAITTVSHNFFRETCLLLKRHGDGWRVLDAYVDVETIDFSAAEVVGTFNGRLLLKYETAGIYAGGVSYESHDYRLLMPDRLQGPNIAFMVESSNTGSMQCLKDAEDPDRPCDCYSRTGKVTFSNHATWDCLEFHYDYQNEAGGCDLENSEVTQAQQVWYMNADTAFQASGVLLSEWAESVTGQVDLKDAEIRRQLGIR